MEGKLMTIVRLLTSAAAAALVIGISTSAIAGNRADPTGDQHRVLPPIKLKNTAVVNGSGGSLAAGFNNIDSGSTLNCGTSSCTISGEDMVQLEAGTNGSLWAICVLVDGNYASPGCPYQGSATSANYQVGNSQQSAVVGSGNHTVQTQVYVANASTLGEWQFTYRIYR